MTESQHRPHMVHAGFVRLVDSMGDDTAIVQAARVSYGQGSKGPNKDTALIRFLLDHNHGTPFEMVQFKFHVKCPIFIMRQWIRHRIGSFNEISARYTEVDEDYYVPDEWRVQAKTNRQASTEGDLDHAALKAIADEAMTRSFGLYQELIKRGVAREQARIVLPVATYTEFYWSVNLRSLFNFLELRMDKHAQFEMQEFARAVLDASELVAPVAFDAWKDMHDGA